MLATGKVEVITGASRARPGPRDGVQPDRRRPARRARSRTSRCCTATPRSRRKGLDTYGSRSLVVGGEALVRAADKVIEKAKPIAAHLLEASVDDIEFAGGRFSVRGTDQGMAIGEIATAVFAAHNLPDGVEPTLDSDATYDPVNFSFPHGTHLCAMEVDTETGALKMRKYVCVRRHRQHHQPAHRRRSGARRPGAGHRPGALGGGGVRRRRHAGVRVVRRLPAADRGRHDQLRHRPHHVAVDHQHARHQGRRRGRHHRLDAGGRQRGRRRGPAPRRQRHPMPCTPERVWQAIHEPAAAAASRPRVRRCRTSTEGTATRTPAEHRKERASDPRTVRLRRADLGRGGAQRARRARRRREDHRRRAEPAAGAPDAAQRARDGHRPRQDRRRCAASATTATRS